jgi:DEAD/DEAH box helicase domain-containing protein
MASSREALAPPASTTLDIVRQFLGTLAARNRADKVLTCVRQIPAREATFRPLPEWVRPELREAYSAKGIAELYSHQAATTELVHNGENVVVVTPCGRRSGCRRRR